MALKYTHRLFHASYFHSESRSVVCNLSQPHRLCSPWVSPGQNTAVGSCSLLQGTVPTQGSNPGLPHCRRILYQLSHQGAAKDLDVDIRTQEVTTSNNSAWLPVRQESSASFSFPQTAKVKMERNSFPNTERSQV